MTATATRSNRITASRSEARPEVSASCPPLEGEARCGATAGQRKGKKPENGLFQRNG